VVLGLHSQSVFQQEHDYTIPSPADVRMNVLSASVQTYLLSELSTHARDSSDNQTVRVNPFALSSGPTNS